MFGVYPVVWALLTLIPQQGIILPKDDVIDICCYAVVELAIPKLVLGGTV